MPTWTRWNAKRCEAERLHGHGCIPVGKIRIYSCGAILRHHLQEVLNERRRRHRHPTGPSFHRRLLARPHRAVERDGLRSAVSLGRIDLPRGRSFQLLLPADHGQRGAGSDLAGAAGARGHTVRGRSALIVVGNGSARRQAVSGAVAGRCPRAGLRRGAAAPCLRGGLRLRLLVHADDSESHVGTDARHPGATGGRLLTRDGRQMNIGIIRERGAFDRRVALTPAVVRRLASAGHTVWVETGAGDGAMYTDPEYLRAGAQIAYSPEEAIGRAELLAKIGRPTSAELNWCAPGMVLMAFYHMAVADRGLVDTLAERSLTAIGCEVIQQDDGRLPVLAAISEIAGQMTVPIAAHLLRSSSGGRGILLGGTPGVPPACVVVLGAGAAGVAAARTAGPAPSTTISPGARPSPTRFSATLANPKMAGAGVKAGANRVSMASGRSFAYTPPVPRTTNPPLPSGAMPKPPAPFGKRLAYKTEPSPSLTIATRLVPQEHAPSEIVKPDGDRERGG